MNETSYKQHEERNPHMEENLTNIKDCWVPVKNFVQQVDWPTAPALRSYIFRAKEFGLQSAFTRVGRRVLVNPKKFFNLITKINLKKELNYEK